MSGTALAALPQSGDRSTWSDSEAALVEASGLTRKEGNETLLADRATVEAFLLHCRRTGLDPIARQIYAIFRGGKWQIQISIDGARLVAERSGQYRGQMPTLWTADGVTWVNVWLSDQPPAAARVAVLRQGFQEPLEAVATWREYAIPNGPMWKKMPALMLGKVAEMLALRKAFPQDLSGLYSSEEMDQAQTTPRASSPAPVLPVPDRDWPEAIAAAQSLEECGALYREAEANQQLGLVVGLAGDNDDGSAHTVMDLFWGRRRELEAPVQEPMTGAGEPGPERDWVAEARRLTEYDAVRALAREAEAAGVPMPVLKRLLKVAEGLQPKDEPTAAEWPVAEIPKDEEVQG